MDCGFEMADELRASTLWRGEWIAYPRDRQKLTKTGASVQHHAARPTFGRDLRRATYCASRSAQVRETDTEIGNTLPDGLFEEEIRRIPV